MNMKPPRGIVELEVAVQLSLAIEVAGLREPRARGSTGGACEAQNDLLATHLQPPTANCPGPAVAKPGTARRPSWAPELEEPRRHG